MNAPEIAAQADTNETIVVPNTPDAAEGKVVNISKGIRLSRGRMVIGGIVLVAAAGLYGTLKSRGEDTHQEQKPVAHAAPEDALHDAQDNHVDATQKILQLEHYKTKAEEALILVTFYERDKKIDGLRECLATLKKWKDEEVAMNGEPEFREVNGLVTTRVSQDEVQKEDLWNRVTDTIERLDEFLNEQTASSAETEQASAEG